MEIKLCNKQSNAKRALHLAAEAARSGARIISLPEVFLTGFCYEEPLEGPAHAAPDPSEELSSFRELSEEYGCLILGSIMTLSPSPGSEASGHRCPGSTAGIGRGLSSGRCLSSNLGFCIEGEKVQFRPKIHPFVNERGRFLGGDFISPIQTGLGKIGLQVCYDVRFPEVGRSLALQGADLLVTVSQFPAARQSQWRVLCLARAIENQLSHIACNWAQGGTSMIISPRGEVVSEAGLGEAIVYGEIDLEARDLFRREVPCFEDRRPEVYRL